MAQRIPKKLRDLRDIPAPQDNRVLGWESGSVANVRITPAMLGRWVGSEPPPVEQRITYEQWLAGAEGYYAWEVIPAPPAPSELFAPVALIEFVATAPGVSAVLGPIAVYPPYAALRVQGVAPAVAAVGTPTPVYPPYAAVAITAPVPTVAAIAAATIAPPAGTLGVTGVVPTLFAYAASLTPPAGAIGVAGVVPTVTAVSGGGGALVPGNASMTTNITSTTAATDTWWKVLTVDPTAATNGGSATVTANVVTSNPAAPWNGSTKVCKCFAQGYSDKGGNYYADAAAVYRFSKTEIDASTGVLTFDFYISAATDAYMAVVARDAGGVNIMASPGTGKCNLALSATGVTNNYYSTWADIDKVTLKASNDVNIQNGKTFNLKAWILGTTPFSIVRLAAGKTWADVAAVDIELHSGNVATGNQTLEFTNFR